MTTNQLVTRHASEAVEDLLALMQRDAGVAWMPVIERHMHRLLSDVEHAEWRVKDKLMEDIGLSMVRRKGRK
jgi:hypothetical protein